MWSFKLRCYVLLDISVLIETALASCNCLRSFSSFIAFSPGVCLEERGWSRNLKSLRMVKVLTLLSLHISTYTSTKKSCFNQASLLWKRFFSSKASRSFIRHRPLQGKHLPVWYCRRDAWSREGSEVLVIIFICVILQNYPDSPCMEDLPAFGPFLG